MILLESCTEMAISARHKQKKQQQCLFVEFIYLICTSWTKPKSQKEKKKRNSYHRWCALMLLAFVHESNANIHLWNTRPNHSVANRFDSSICGTLFIFDKNRKYFQLGKSGARCYVSFLFGLNFSCWFSSRFHKPKIFFIAAISV